MDIMMGVLEAKSCVINEMARAINMKAWILHKRIQRFDKYCDEGMIDINYHKIGFKIAKKEYRGCRFIPAIVDYTSIFDAFGVGIKKPEKIGINRKGYFIWH